MMFVLNGPLSLLVVVMALTTDNILTGGSQIGGANNNTLLGALVLVLIVVVIYRERQQNKANAKAEKRQEAIAEQLEKDHLAFDNERRARIDFLMELVAKCTAAIAAQTSSSDSLKTSVDANTNLTQTLILSLNKANGHNP